MKPASLLKLQTHLHQPRSLRITGWRVRTLCGRWVKAERIVKPPTCKVCRAKFPEYVFHTRMPR